MNTFNLYLYFVHPKLTKQQSCKIREAKTDKIEWGNRKIHRWEKIFANFMSDKGLVSIINKELLQINSKQEKQQQQIPENAVFKMGRKFEQTFLQRICINVQ